MKYYGHECVQWGRWTEKSCSLQPACSGYLPLERPFSRGGAPVSLEIHLPPLERNALRHLNLVAKDKVTRVTDTDQDSGFAATGRFEPHEIVV
jgi:hypothetical protein